MNLSADQYLNMIDQMTVLRLSNQRNQRDKAILAEQVERQKLKLQQLSSNNTIVSTKNAEYGNRSDCQKYNGDVRKFNKTADDYIEEFKNTITSMQNKICQFITANNTDQMKQIKNQILKIKEDIKPITRDLPKEKENKQNPFSIHLKQSKQRGESKRLNKVQFENKENYRTPENRAAENKPASKQQQKEKQKEVEEFYKKVKFIYGLWNKEKKQPSLQQLYAWVNKINAQSSSLPLNNDFNPIQASKKARSQKKLITFNNISKQPGRIEKSHHKSSKRLNQRDLDSQNQYQKQTQNYFKNYIQPSKNSQNDKAILKKNDKNSNETTKKSDQPDEQDEFSPMVSKIKEPPQKSKSKQNIPPKIQKISKLQHNENRKKQNEKPINKSQTQEKVNKNKSKENILSKGKIERQNQKQRKTHKDIKNSKSLELDSKKIGSKPLIPRNKKGSASQINPGDKENSKPASKNQKNGTQNKIEKNPISNSKGPVGQKKDPKNSIPKNKKNQSQSNIKPRRESVAKK